MVGPYDALAMAIFMFEGARSATPSVRCVRNNNPGNLRPYKKGQVTDGDNYRVFTTFLDGWNALQADLHVKVKEHMEETSTFLDLLALYAPAGDHNNPSQYAKFVCEWMTDALGRMITTNTLVRPTFEGA